MFRHPLFTLAGAAVLTSAIWIPLLWAYLTGDFRSHDSAATKHEPPPRELHVHRTHALPHGEIVEIRVPDLLSADIPELDSVCLIYRDHEYHTATLSCPSEIFLPER